MSPIPFLSKSRGIGNLTSRIISVLRRFGFSSKKFERLLNRYSAITREMGCAPTLPITAVVLKRHPELGRKLCQQGIELAVHGYIHTDYGVLPFETQVEHYRKAISTFKECRIPFTGFRAPLVQINGKTPHALQSLGFLYDSSLPVHWDVIDRTKYSKGSWHEYERLLELYQPLDARNYLVLPRLIDGFVEIPLSIPDDEVMVDRLNIHDARKIGEVWGAILDETYRRGELFTLQLHPERIAICEMALVEVLKKAGQSQPPVWIATLGEISTWWQEKERFAFTINSPGENKYRVFADCTDSATILSKNCKVNTPARNWCNGYQSIKARDFVLESPSRPVIGVSPDTSPAAISFLHSEGFIVERSEQPCNYGIYLTNLAQFSIADEKPLSQKIEKSDAPLLRYWRWPNEARSALSVTGDIDSITVTDFALRILENWWQSRK